MRDSYRWQEFRSNCSRMDGQQKADRQLKDPFAPAIKGGFVFSDLRPGDYAVRVDSYPFVGVEIHDIHVGEAEDRRVRRIILEAGSGAGNCVVRLSPMNYVQHTAAAMSRSQA